MFDSSDEVAFSERNIIRCPKCKGIHLNWLQHWDSLDQFFQCDDCKHEFDVDESGTLIYGRDLN